MTTTVQISIEIDMSVEELKDYMAKLFEIDADMVIPMDVFSAYLEGDLPEDKTKVAKEFMYDESAAPLDVDDVKMGELRNG